MSTPNAAVSRDQARRMRWATRENQRRQETFARADLAWTQEDQVLNWMITTAHSGSGFQPGQVGSRFTPKRGETLFGVFSDCRLIEVKRGAGSYQGSYAGFSYRVSKNLRAHVGGSRGTYVQGAEELRITDEGEVVVTNQRVVFQGQHNSREWSFSKLISAQHDQVRPISMIHVSNRMKVSGVAYKVEQASQVRFAIELGAALQSGTNHALAGTLEAERDAHARLRPAIPDVLSPADAPSRAARLASGVKTVMTGRPGQSPKRRVAHTAIAGVVAFLLLNGLIGAFAAGSPQGRTVAASAPTSQTTISAQTSASPARPTTAEAAPSAAPAETPTTEASSTPTATPTVEPDEQIDKVTLGKKPVSPKLLPTHGTSVRVGATCRDGSSSYATGRGACSWHGGVAHWEYEQPSWVEDNKQKNAERTKAYKNALKKWTASNARNQLLTKYPCSKGPYPKGKPGYAAWRDTNHNGIACDK